MPDAPTDRDLFDEMLELAPPEREAAIARLDIAPERKARLAKLLNAERRASNTTGFLDRSLVAAVAEAGRAVIQADQLPKRLGHFLLLRELGSGGMGIVYEAEQAHPNRRVALKLMRADMGARELAQRFRREIDTLGRLQHPNIAQIYEAGTINEGEWARAPVPYIAMQLVAGTALDDWVSAERPAPRRILELIATACDAIHHAHQRGVVHRDLKPANILVVREPDDRPRPMLLDFGIARLTERGGGTPMTIATSAGQILGTLAYMSPEQLGGDPTAIDARTDVYALGVILYEMLAGRSPLDVRDRPIADAARIIRDEEPTRLGVIDGRLRGDLETIVAKAIEKDPARRYPTASALGEELRRFLRDEPILAKPTTRVERIRRFTRRHRAMVAGVSATMLALVAGTIAAGIFATRALHERDSALWQAYRANIAAASAALAGHEVGSARRYLNAAEPALRGWEWRYLWASLDRSHDRIDLDRSLVPHDRQLQSVPSPWAVLATRSDRAAIQSRIAVPPVGEPPTPTAGLARISEDGAQSIWFDAQTSSEPARVIVVRTGAPTTTIPLTGAPRCSPEAAALSPTNDAVAIISADGEADGSLSRWSVRWHRLDGSDSRQLDVRNSGRHFALACGANGLVAIGGSPAGHPCVWNAADGRVVELRGHTGDINSVALSPDGRFAATGGADRTVRLFNIADGATLAIARDHLDQVNSVAFSSDSSIVVSASTDRTVRLWRLPDLAGIASLDGHADSVMAAEFTANDGRIVSLDASSSLRVWEANPSLASGDLRVPDNSWGAIDIARDATRMVTTNSQQRVRVWSLEGGYKEEAIGEPDPVGVSQLALSPDGTRLAALSLEQHALLLRVEDGAVTSEWRSAEKVVCVGFTSDGEAIATQLGTAPLGERLCRLPEMSPLPLPLPHVVGPSIQSNRDGSLMALRDAGADGAQEIAVLDARSGRELWRTAGAYGWAHAITTLPEGNSVVACIEKQGDLIDGIRAITVRDARSGHVLRQLEGHTAHIFTVAFSPDGSRLASGGRDRLIRIWDTSTWELIASLPGPTSYVWALRFSGDGELLASSGGDRTYRVWRAPNAP